MRGISSAMTSGIIRQFVALATALALVTAPLMAREKSGGGLAFFYEASNGFTLETQGKGVLVVQSPWRESLRFRLKTLADSNEFQFGDVTYRTWPDAATLHRNNETVAAENIYDSLVAAGLEHASVEFWAGLAEAVEELGNSGLLLATNFCGLDGMACFWALVAELGSLALLIAVCGATLGVGCLPALLGHVAASGLAATTCGRWLICLDSLDDRLQGDLSGSRTQPGNW